MSRRTAPGTAAAAAGSRRVRPSLRPAAMRPLLVAARLVAASALPVAAQQPAARDSAALAAAGREAATVYNATATLRSLGPLQIDSGQTVDGDVAVIDGPLDVAGRVTGRVVAINADVRLRPGAVIEGDLLAFGGTVTGADAATVRGGVRRFADSLAYREVGDAIAVGDDDADTIVEWLARLRARREQSGTRFLLTTGKTYNRVEGLPVLAGPSFRGRYPWGEVDAEALGVLRTADGARWDAENLGHLGRAEVRLGVGRGLFFGGALYDAVRPVEDWHLDDDEVGLASAVLRRDYRDYFGAHGGGLHAGAFFGPDAEVRVRYADERWTTRRARDPISIFRNGGAWRANPAADEGEFHLAGATVRVDTRNVVDNPWSGWYVVADYERGTGTVTSFAPLTPGVRGASNPDVRYGRGFLDVRRYNRVSPTAQVNLRLVAGGWLHGDALPAQRRLSVAGPGTLPGYDFRDRVGATDANQCTTGGAVPLAAQCDRVVLLQAEYRNDLRLSLGLDDVEIRSALLRRTQWVAFLDTGRGWLVGDAPTTAGDDAALWLSRGRLPALGSLRTDVGAGIDFGLLGIYVAKAVSDAGSPANLYVRLRARF